MGDADFRWGMRPPYNVSTENNSRKRNAGKSYKLPGFFQWLVQNFYFFRNLNQTLNFFVRKLRSIRRAKQSDATQTYHKRCLRGLPPGKIYDFLERNRPFNAILLVFGAIRKKINC